MNANNRKRALITGATGFVGSHLARKLVSDQWDVHLVVRPNSNLDSINSIKNSVKIHSHDGSTKRMKVIFEKAKPDIVFHLASLFLVQHEGEDIEAMIQSNILLGTQLVEAMTANGVHKLVNTGTAWQHYENEDNNPVNLYAATKQAFEAILKYYTEATPLKIIILKLCDTYGPDDPRPKLFALLQEGAKEKKSIAMSPGEQLIDLVYIDDVIDAFMLAAYRLFKGEVKKTETYAVSSGKPIKLRELVEVYNNITETPLPVRWGGRPYRFREVMVPWNKGSFVPGWRPKINLEEGIKNLFGK